jgi:hypothetical protein
MVRIAVLLALVLALSLGAPATSASALSGRVQRQITTVSPTPSPSASTLPGRDPRDPSNAIVGLVIITLAGLAGYQVSRALRKNNRTRPRGPWFGGKDLPH